ncbi:PREDICTED: E3 ubiquitin ligase BIG BROTHER-related [Tarenaya hassleriana]|uniref:E3 ubiquitin ligase BIG BROTHER-related n=1 Tax=Tarenaya hassleriana TaxID=28532 RepID=UPI00053C1E0A|nr:PREDICTED: E3 ubiquitin ligase BIG BROTHER-related [Tarenaya hassleriana]
MNPNSRSDQEAMDEALAWALQFDDSYIAVEDDAAIARRIQQEEDARVKNIDEELARKLQSMEDDRIKNVDEELARKLQSMEDQVPPNSISEDEAYARLLQAQGSESDDIAHRFQGLEVSPASNLDIPSTSSATHVPHDHGNSSIVSPSDSSHSAPAPPDEIDPDNMTYEELNELEESIGDVSNGLRKKEISRLPSSKFGSETSQRKDEMCSICHTEYKSGDTIKTLPCGHAYHEHCIAEWLAKKKICCVCKAEVKPRR